MRISHRNPRCPSLSFLHWLSPHLVVPAELSGLPRWCVGHSRRIVRSALSHRGSDMTARTADASLRMIVPRGFAEVSHSSGGRKSCLRSFLRERPGAGAATRPHKADNTWRHPPGGATRYRHDRHPRYHLADLHHVAGPSLIPIVSKRRSSPGWQYARSTVTFLPMKHSAAPLAHLHRRQRVRLRICWHFGLVRMMSTATRPTLDHQRMPLLGSSCTACCAPPPFRAS